MRISGSLRLLFGVAAVGFVLAYPKVSSAHSGDSDPTHIHACIGPQGQTRIVQLAEACRPSEVAAHWAVEGPRGETGATGPKGDPGPKDRKSTRLNSSH